MASQNPNLLKRLYENVMGTPEQNKKAAEEMKNYPPEQKFQKMMGKGKKEEAAETTEEPVKKRSGGMALKQVDKKKNPGLAKLPTPVRNKMGYMKTGGSVTMASRRGDGCAVRGKTKAGIK